MGRIRLAYGLSIAANLVFAVFLGLLGHNQAGTLRWVHRLNPFWIFSVAIAIVVLVALATGLPELYGKTATTKAPTETTQVQADEDGNTGAQKADPATTAATG